MCPKLPHKLGEKKALFNERKKYISHRATENFELIFKGKGTVVCVHIGGMEVRLHSSVGWALHGNGYLLKRELRIVELILLLLL
jgi:hypothetical protein